MLWYGRGSSAGEALTCPTPRAAKYNALARLCVPHSSGRGFVSQIQTYQIHNSVSRPYDSFDGSSRRLILCVWYVHLHLNHGKSTDCPYTRLGGLRSSTSSRGIFVSAPQPPADPSPDLVLDNRLQSFLGQGGVFLCVWECELATSADSRRRRLVDLSVHLWVHV